MAGKLYSIGHRTARASSWQYSRDGQGPLRLPSTVHSDLTEDAIFLDTKTKTPRKYSLIIQRTLTFPSRLNASDKSNTFFIFVHGVHLSTKTLLHTYS